VTHEANFLVQETRKRCDENHDPQIVERQRDTKEQSGPFLVIDFTITCIKKSLLHRAPIYWIVCRSSGRHPQGGV
jgi:hypothetical protein